MRALAKRGHLILIASFLLLSACATTPEAKLKRGYDLISVTAAGTTVLVNRDAISVEEAQRALTLGTTAKSVLDSGKAALKKCRATPGAKCTAAVANINLGSGVLLELERYLEANQ